MHEAKADYDAFLPLAQAACQYQGRPDLADRLTEKKFQNLFLHPADHPMGYEDGVSGVSWRRLDRRTKALNKEDFRTLRDISTIVLDYMDMHQQPDADSTRTAFLGANQLIQHNIYREGYWRSADARKIAERITKNYLESGITIKEWDAQQAENESFHHAGALNGYCMTTMMTAMTPIALYGIAQVAGVDNETVNNTLMTATSIGLAGMLTHLLQYPLIVAQDMGDSPNLANKLVVNKHYRFVRHPLYSHRIIANFVAGAASLNPLGWRGALKSLEHGAKACEAQDRRMRILFGEDAEEYQANTPALMPGAKLIERGLEKLLLASTMDFLRTPVTELLPRIKDSILIDEPRAPYAFKGTANAHRTTSIEPANEKLNLAMMYDTFAPLVSLPIYAVTLGYYGKRAEDLKIWDEKKRDEIMQRPARQRLERRAKRLAKIAERDRREQAGGSLILETA